MPKQSTQFDFGDSREPQADFTLHDRIITDRGSVYSVSIGLVHNRAEIKTFLTKLKAQKKYQTATHHSYAVRISRAGTIFETKRDDGETGAGMVILRVMQKHNVSNCVVCVTRWFGGTKLMADRFTHIQTATSYALERL